MRFPYEICRVLLHTFLMRFPYEMSCFLAIMRCPCEIFLHLLLDFRTRYPEEMSCFFGPSRALRMRFHSACLAVVRFLDEIACFLAAEFPF
jgi:hypothetical protein